jgi:hypothetical protein
MKNKQETAADALWLATWRAINAYAMACNGSSEFCNTTSTPEAVAVELELLKLWQDGHKTACAKYNRKGLPGTCCSVHSKLCYRQLPSGNGEPEIWADTQSRACLADRSRVTVEHLAALCPADREAAEAVLRRGGATVLRWDGREVHP